jgi:hypothetical protein
MKIWGSITKWIRHLNTENDEFAKEEVEVIKRWACLPFSLILCHLASRTVQIPKNEGCLLKDEVQYGLQRK